MRQTRQIPLLFLFLATSLATTACKSTKAPADASAPSGTNPEGAAQDPAAQQESVADLSASDAQRLVLGEQRKHFLVEQHLESARALLGQLRLAEAQREAEAALELEPDSLRAKDLRAEALSLQGQPAGDTRTVAEEMRAQYELRVQQMKAEVADSLAKAGTHVARNDYQGAITELEIANNLVKFSPYSINWEGLDAEAKSMLEKVRSTRVNAEQASEETARRKATEALRTREAAVIDRKQAQVDSMLEQAINSFEIGEYEDAENYAKQALNKEPRNEQAREIKDAAFRAGRTKVREEYVKAKSEQFRRWKEHMKELQVPWSKDITLPSADFWNGITESRSHRRGLDLTQKVGEDERALGEQLRSTAVKLPPIKDEESLTKVIDSLRIVSGLPLVVDPAAEAAMQGTVFTFNFENRITAEQALNLITKAAGEGVAWTIRHQVVLITTKEKARNRPVIVNHDVQDLVFALTDFTGPRINELRLLDKMTDDDGGGPFGGIGEKPKIIDGAELVALIQANVGVGTWAEEGVSIEAGDGFILINHAPEIQEQVRQFLNDLRRFSSSLVTIESKFLTVGNNWLQQIGVDFRGIDGIEVSDVTNGLEDQASRGLDNGGSGTDGQNAAGHPSAGVFYDDGQDGDFRGTTQNYFGTALGSALSTIGGMTFQLSYLNDINLSSILRLVEKSSNVDLVNDQILSVHNTQRAYVAVINQRAYIQDFDVEVAQFQAVADPQVNVLNEGVVLDVRPTIQHNRKYLTLEIQPTVAKVVALRDFSSTLGGNTSPIRFQLPELEVQSVFTTAIIPDGGSIMLGGLSSVRNIERRAEVPWLGRIPIVGFLFKQEGYNDENKSLVILIRARITDVRDELKKLEVR